MTLSAALSISTVRWETPTEEEFASSLAASLQTTTGATEVEVFVCGPSASRVLGEAGRATVTTVEPSPSVQSEVRRRPRGGWGAELEGAGAERVSLRPSCRHGDGYVILWTPRGRVDADARAELEAALGTLFDARVLLQRVARLSRAAHSENRHLRQSFRDRVAVDPTMRSAPMVRCLERADAVAPYDTPVLLTGPSGAGKEVVARRIHARSSRTARPFIKLNCGAIPEALAESELFGHERGAFTGATTRRRGVFERTAGGTLLLDEVGELSPAVQVKLLRVLQEGTFVPVGGERELHSAARVLAATHCDLSAGVAQGSFREDLFYRLAVFEVAVPGLRERVEDLPSLAQQIVERIAARMGRSVPQLPRCVMAQLLAHEWPGNVRELENVLEGALVMSRGAALDGPLLLRIPRRGAGESPASVVPLEATVRGAIEAALGEAGGKLYGPGGAAELLELNPATLQSKMRKLGIDRQEFVRD